MKVHIVVDPRWKSDRILPRMVAILAKGTGWTVSGKEDTSADINYAFTYLEAQRITGRFAGLFTHREDVLQHKVKVWTQQAERAALRVVLAKQYSTVLAAYGPTVQIPPPLDRDLFSLAAPQTARSLTRPLIGVSGFTYAGGRKGEGLVKEILAQPVGKKFRWTAVGEGWPIKTKLLNLQELPDWYRELDAYLCPSLIEGVPYGVLEALACGIPVIVPKGVGIVDELPANKGILRYTAGSVASLTKQLMKVPSLRPDPQSLRALTEGFTEAAWIMGHLEAFEALDVPIATIPFSEPTASPLPKAVQVFEPLVELEELVGRRAREKKGVLLDEAEARRIAQHIEGHQEREDAFTVLRAYGERPLRLVPQGFQNGCRSCGRALNYCGCRP